MDKGRIIYSGKTKDLAENYELFENRVTELMGGYKKEESLVAKSYVPHDTDMEYTVFADNLVKKYGDFYAVKNNTFKIKKGEIFGLLGPNGAGKSTSFKMMCGLSKPTSGTTKIFGTDMKENPTKARSYLGYMAQKFSLYGNLTVEQNLNFFAGVYGLNKKDKQQRIDEMIKSFNFETVLKQKADELPLGFKQRLSMACAVMHNPPVLFLDEPTSGVDVVARRDFWNHITSLAKKGVTVLITTHFMDEAEFCDRISLFYRGQTIAIGTPKELKEKASAKNMEETFINLIKESEVKN